MSPSFIHLRIHTEFSLIDGLVKIKPLVKQLAKLEMPAVAVTDHVNLFGLVKLYKTATASGIKPIAGADVLIFNPDEPQNPFQFTFLAQNQAGYVTLTELVSQAYQQGQSKDGVPMLKREWIEKNNVGLIALSGAMQGDVGRALVANKKDDALHCAMYWQNLFPNRFYLELQRVGKPNEEHYISEVLNIAYALNLPVVATNDVRFLAKEEFAAHEIRVCINQGRVLEDAQRPKDYTAQQYLRSAEEMQALFADIPEALENSVEIAKRCSLTLTLGKNFLPDFPTPEGMTINDLIIAESEKGLLERLKQHSVPNEADYHERLKIELNVITQMGFSGYFMIVADFIQWAKNHGIPVGPGRGSGAGSLVAYALKITDLDPIEFELLFERFLNPERVSMPDFDIDFCMDRRDEVIDYVADNYGRDQVSQIITYGSMAAKAVIRDVGRVLGLGYGFVDRLAKMIPTEVGITLSDALKNNPEMQQAYNNEEEVKTLIDMALLLEGTARNAGKHAGGVVIAPTKLTDFSPLYCDSEGNNLVTQYDKSDVESVGLVKFDFLGLRTLTIIDWALQTINEKNAKAGKPAVDISQIPRDDFASYDLLKKGLTTAVFQLESRGMKELIKKLLPDCFNDIIALVALFRPGPLESGMVDDYVNVKHKRKAAEYPHPLIEPILEPTNGVILYQEQVMQIAQVLSGYSLGGADILRRCLSGSTEIVDAETGKCVTLQAVANNQSYWIGRDVFSLDLTTQKIVHKPITAIFDNGIRDVFEVTTKTNRKIRATTDHLFYTVLGWQKLESFKIGDSIGLTKNLPILHKNQIDEAEIKIAAYLIGDGYLSQRKRIGSYFCNSDELLINDFNNCCQELFGRNVPVALQHHEGKKSVAYARINFAEFNVWINEKLKRACSQDKEIPLWVYELSLSQLALFLGTLWSTDGTFDISIGHSDYTSTSRKLIEQIQHLLLRFGIVGLFNVKKSTYKNQPHFSYRVQITGREDMLKFYDLIVPFMSIAKREKAKVCHSLIQHKLKNQSKHQLPAAVTNLVYDAKLNSGMTWAEMDERIGFNKGVLSGGINFKNPCRELSRHRMANFARVFDDSKLQAIAESEVFWDKIASIELIGQERVFDLTIPETHNFIANDFVAHNCMGKKDSVEMAKQRDVFVSGAEKNGVDKDLSNYIFDLVDKFSGYGFNKTLAFDTKICTIAGNKNIEDCKAGDVVFSMNTDGSVVKSIVVALHDHGHVPLWEVEFNDGTREKCTLDHKWLTEKGQLPLWKILHMDYEVWGTSADTTRYEVSSEKMFDLHEYSQGKTSQMDYKVWRTSTNIARHIDSSKTMFNLHEPNSNWTKFWQRHCHVLWRNCANRKESQNSFSIMRSVSYQTARNSSSNLQKFGSYRRNATTLFRNSEENSSTPRYSKSTFNAIKKLEGQQSRKIRGNSYQSPCVTKIFQNGNLLRASSRRMGICSQCATIVWKRKNAQTSRFCSQKTKNCHRSGWTVAFSANSLTRKFGNCSGTRPFIESRNYSAQLAVNSIVNGMLQKQHGCIDCANVRNVIQQNRRQNVDGRVVLRKPVRATFVGFHQGYDLEVDHPEHNFLLSSGLCCSNSHSAAYALVAYQTAWLKAHYPAAFMAAVLSADMDNTDKIVINIEECRALNIKIIPPSINKSEFKFTVNDNGELVYGLGALKGAGEAALLDMIEERRINGFFSDLYDLCKRVDLRKFNKRVSEALTKAGVLDEFHLNRAAHLAELPTAFRVAEHYSKMKLAGQSDLFGLGGENNVSETESENLSYVTETPFWSDKIKFAEEKSVLGLFLTGHPIDQYADELNQIAPKKLRHLISEISPNRRTMPVKVAGLAIDIGSRQNKQGNMRGFAILDDNTARLEIAAYREVFGEFQSIFTADYRDKLLIAEGNLTMDSYLNVPLLTVDKIYPIENARKIIQLTFKNNSSQFEKLAEFLKSATTGKSEIHIDYFSTQARAVLRLGNQWHVQATDELLYDLKVWLGAEAVQIRTTR